MATTANELIDAALEDLGVRAQGETLSAADAQTAFQRLNRMIRTLRLAAAFSSSLRREVFDLTASDAEYTMGPGGDFNVTVKPNALTAAALVLTTSDPTVEVPLPIITNSSYTLLQIKALESRQPTTLWFNPTSTNDRATIILWPVPSIGTNDLALYWQDLLGEFATLTTEYILPDGLPETLQYNLGKRLVSPFGVSNPSIIDRVDGLARETLGAFRRQNANTQLIDVPTDPALTHSRVGWYNIQSGIGGGQ